MKTLAILGGMTPDVTALYYNLINAQARQRLGGRSSARLYVFSADLDAQLRRVEAGDWDGFAAEYVDAVAPLLAADASGRPRVDGVLLGAILAHKAGARLAAALPPGVAFLHVADFVARGIRARDAAIRRVGLVGPAVTMADSDPDFFRGRLERDHDLEVLVPATEAERDAVHRGMFEEVVRGRDAVQPATRAMFVRAAQGLVDRGAQALVLGSTDLGFVLDAADFTVPVFDAAKLHAVGVAEWALSDEVGA